MNSRGLFFATIFFLAGVELVAQANSFVGVWRVQVAQSIDLMDPTYRARFDTLSSEVKERAVYAMTGREFTFHESGSITVKWASPAGQKNSMGTWVVDNTTGQLHITIGERPIGFDYVFPSHMALILRAKQKKGFFDNLYLEKMN